MWVRLLRAVLGGRSPVDNASTDSNSRMTLQKGFCKMLQMIKFAQLPLWLVIRIEMHWNTPLLLQFLQISPILQCKVNVVTAVLQSIISRKLLQTDALLWLFYNFWMCIIIQRAYKETLRCSLQAYFSIKTSKSRTGKQYLEQMLISKRDSKSVSIHHPNPHTPCLSFALEKVCWLCCDECWQQMQMMHVEMQIWCMWCTPSMSAHHNH